MSVLETGPAGVAVGAAGRVARVALRLVPPVATPGLDRDIARVARVFAGAQQHRQPVGMLRASYELDGRAWQGRDRDGVRTADEELDLRADASGPARTVRVRTYTPSDGGGGALVYIHGGGFVIGSIASHDGVCRRLAARSGVIVQSIEYRLAPEHPFPAGLTDIAAAWSALHRRWVEGGGDPARIGVGGDSAGGHGGATVVDEAVDPTLGVEVPMPGFCWMIYPGVTLMHDDDRMARTLPTGGLLSGAMANRFADLHAPDRAVRAAPALNPLDRPVEVLAQHPRSWIQTVGLDPLLEQDRAYVTALRAAGVDVEHEHEATMAHGYISMTGVSRGAAEALSRAADALRRLAAG